MDGWHEVATLAELEEFLQGVGRFHDGVLKEVHWINRDDVDASLRLDPYHLADARVLVQRQWKDPSAVEMVFKGVWRLDLNTIESIFWSDAKVEMSSGARGEPRPLLVLGMEESSIAFERMRWRDASEWMGPEARFGPFDVPLAGESAAT